jgi:hypothetical protein
MSTDPAKTGIIGRSSPLQFALRILGSRWSIVVAAIIAGLIALSFLGLGWMFDDTYQRLIMRNTPSVREYVPEKFSFDPLRGYYVFLDHNTERTYFLKDKGLLPWWADEKTEVAFWRPISSLTYILDFSLWPDEPILFHVQNGIWFVLLSIIAMILFRRFITPLRIAGIAGIVFVLSASVLMPAAWISNRHTLVAMCFCLLSLVFFDKYHSDTKLKKTNLGLAMLTFVLSLFSSELGIVSFAFILAYTIILTDVPLVKKIWNTLPFLLLIVAWRFVYTLLGFGVKGSEIYTDPIASPVAFLIGFPAKLPFILADSLISIPSDIYGYCAANAVPAAALILLVLLAVVGFVFAPVVNKNKKALFWIVCMVLASVPLCSTTPAQRHLSVLSLCAIGLLFTLVSSTIEAQREKPVRRHVLRILLGAIISIKLVSGIAGVLLLPESVKLTKGLSAEFLDFGTARNLANRDIVIVAPPIIHFTYSLTAERLFEGLPMPRHVRVLAPPFTGMSVTRIDAKTLEIDTDTGYYPPPLPAALPSARTQMAIVPFRFPDFINPIYSYLRLDRIFLDGSFKPQIGDTTNLSNMKARVTGLTEDRRIKSVRFEFGVPLDDPSFVIMTWDWKTKKYVPFIVPDIAQSIRIDRY